MDVLTATYLFVYFHCRVIICSDTQFPSYALLILYIYWYGSTYYSHPDHRPPTIKHWTFQNNKYIYGNCRKELKSCSRLWAFSFFFAFHLEKMVLFPHPYANIQTKKECGQRNGKLKIIRMIRDTCKYDEYDRVKFRYV